MRVYTLQDMEKMYPVVFKGLDKEEQRIARAQIELYKPFDSDRLRFFEWQAGTPVKEVEISKTEYVYFPRGADIYPDQNEYTRWTDVAVELCGPPKSYLSQCVLRFPLAQDEVSIEYELKRSVKYIPDACFRIFKHTPIASMRWEVSEIEILKKREKHAKVALSVKWAKLNEFKNPFEYWWSVVAPVLDGYKSFSRFDVAKSLFECEFSLESLTDAKTEIGILCSRQAVLHVRNLWRMMCLEGVPVPYRKIGEVYIEDPEVVLFATPRGKKELIKCINENILHGWRKKFGTDDMSTLSSRTDGSQLLEQAFSSKYEHSGRVEFVVRMGRDL